MYKGKIVIVDDNKEFLEELEEVLTSSGYNIITAQDPVSALAIASKEIPKIILLDLKMPGKSGLQLAAEIKEDPCLSEIPIIAMSSFYKNGDFPILKVNGIKSCLRKPFKPAEIIAAIEEALVEKSTVQNLKNNNQRRNRNGGHKK